MMTQYISKINAVIPGTEKAVPIDLQGKNLIITGGNGCGKTRFLKELHSLLLRRLDASNVANLPRIQLQLQHHINVSKTPNITPQQLANNQVKIKAYQQQFDNISGAPSFKIELCDEINAGKEATANNLLIRFFEATRQYSLPANRGNQQHLTVDSMQQQGKSRDLKQDDSATFETYLVTYLTAGYMAYGLRKDDVVKNKVDAWLDTITSDLRFLFEDESLELVFREKERVYYIEQDGKIPYKISDLSSGYSSILKIYTDLLMKVELREITSKELSGIVIIDEIDAHLHVSLQKKILSFFDNAYPNVQFIVSTHSPFVIQSVDNAVIYDLSKREQLENLSLYSYEAIVKGLLGVKTTSDTLTGLVSELSELIPNIEDNRERIEALIVELASNQSKLDSRSKVALLMAQQAVLDVDVDGE